MINQQTYFLLPQKALQCSVCLEVLRKPVMEITNGHTFCSRCVKNSKICPMCRKPAKWQANRAVQQLLQQILTNCSFKSCQWRGRLSQIRDHLQVCQSKKQEDNLQFEQTCRKILELFEVHIRQHLQEVHPAVFNSIVKRPSWLLCTSPLKQVFNNANEQYQSVQCVQCNEFMSNFDKQLKVLQRERLRFIVSKSVLQVPECDDVIVID